MHQPATPSAEELIATLERQLSLVGRLSELSATQAELIADGRGDRLLELLSRRQSIIDEFAASQRELGYDGRDLDQRMSRLPEPQRRRIRELVGGIGAALHTVIDRDQRDQQALHAGCSATRSEIAGLDNGRTARQAYGHARHTVNRFADQKA